MSKYKSLRNSIMHEKFMNIKKLILPTLTVLMLTSQLTGCSTANSAEAMNMLKANETIEINIPEPENIEEGEQLQFNWTELAYLDSYSELRSTMDDALLIIPMADNGKNGVIYVTEDGNHSNNTTLQDAFNNKKFINNYWNNKETNQRIIAASKQTFSDVEDESDASCLLAAYSSYYNLLNDTTPEYANMQSTLSRIEAMSLLFRAVNPVDNTLQVSDTFTSKVGDNEHSLFAEQIDKSGLTYLTSENSSLDESTATGTMTRAEYIYMLVQNFYADEYNTLTKDDIKSFTKSTEFADLQNAGNVAKEQKYIYTEKNKETGIKEEKSYNRYQAYELNYCLNNVEDGLTENLYKAYVVADKHGILTDTEETGWELGLTKEYALELLTNVLEETGGNVNFDRGESKGEIIINKVEENTTVEVTEGQGGDKSLLNSVEITEDGSNNFYSINEDGRYEVKPDLVALINETTFGAGATVTEIEKFINENSDLVFFIENDDIEGFMQILESIYTTSGKLSTEQQVTITTPSTSTETASNNQTTTSTSGTTSSSNNTSGSTSSSSGSSSSGGSSSSTSSSSHSNWDDDSDLPPSTWHEGNASGIGLTGDAGDGGELGSAIDIH